MNCNNKCSFNLFNRHCIAKHFWHPSEWSWLNGKFNYRVFHLHCCRKFSMNITLFGSKNIWNFSFILSIELKLKEKHRERENWIGLLFGIIWKCMQTHFMCNENVNECIFKIFHLLDSNISIKYESSVQLQRP